MAKAMAKDMKNDLKKEAQAAVKDATKEAKRSFLGCIFDAVCGCDPFEAIDAAKEVHSAVKGTGSDKKAQGDDADAPAGENNDDD